MANNRDDFAPEIRNSAWWASDTRQAANGKAVDTILIKQGKLPPPDLSHIEAVQMGHVMQPVIGRLAQDRLKMEFHHTMFLKSKYLWRFWILTFVILFSINQRRCLVHKSC